MSEYVLLRRKLYICTAVRAVKMNNSSNPIKRFLMTHSRTCTPIVIKIPVKNVLGTNGLKGSNLCYLTCLKNLIRPIFLHQDKKNRTAFFFFVAY